MLLRLALLLGSVRGVGADDGAVADRRGGRTAHTARVLHARPALAQARMQTLCMRRDRAQPRSKKENGVHRYPNGAEASRNRSASSHTCQKWQPFGPTGQLWPAGADLGRLRPDSVRHRPLSLGPHLQISTKHFPGFPQQFPDIGRNRPNTGRHRSTNLTNFDQHVAGIMPNSTNVGPEMTKFGPNLLTKIGPELPGLGHKCPGAHTWPDVDQSQPEVDVLELRAVGMMAGLTTVVS